MWNKSDSYALWVIEAALLRDMGPGSDREAESFSLRHREWQTAIEGCQDESRGLKFFALDASFQKLPNCVS
jgi:hypothetical protein